MWRRVLSIQLSAATWALVVGCQPHAGAPAAPAQVPPRPAAPSPNFIGNGDLSRGTAPWGATALMASGARELKTQLRDGALCVSLPAHNALILGWPVDGSPDRLSITAGHRYQLSLRASSTSAALDCVAKVGHQLPPYTAVSVAPMTLTPSFQLFQFPFAADHDDDRAGIAVECRAAPGSSDADVCIDDVVFVAL